MNLMYFQPVNHLACLQDSSYMRSRMFNAISSFHKQVSVISWPCWEDVPLLSCSNFGFFAGWNKKKKKKSNSVARPGGSCGIANVTTTLLSSSRSLWACVSFYVIAKYLNLPVHCRVGQFSYNWPFTKQRTPWLLLLTFTGYPIGISCRFLWIAL